MDITNYTADTQAVLINEINNNIVGFEDVSIIGGAANGIGIEVQSDNCYIEQCNILQMKTGIYLNGAEKTRISRTLSGVHVNYGLHLNGADFSVITGNSFTGNTSYGIYIFNSDYCIISNTGCTSNLTGIYSDSSDYNTISSCLSNSNSENGIFITLGSYNTISSNTLNNNDSNIAGDTAGLFITNNSDFNTITGNTVNDNNNTGAGIGYGIFIATADCNENVVAANNANGNDIDYQDSGTATTITYYVQNTDELQDAIDSIGTKAGIININASFTVATTINIDGGGSYIIQGEGSNSTLTTNDNITCFHITNARSVLFENFKIDVSAWTVAGRDQEIIEINEVADNLIIINNVTIQGNDFGYGIEANSKNVQIKNCRIDDLFYGLLLRDDNCLASENIIDSCNSYGMDITGDYCSISHNTITNCKQGIQLNGCNYVGVDSNIITGSLIIAGIYIFNLTGANISNNLVSGMVNGSGIILDDVNSSTIIGNICDNNDGSSVNELGAIIIGDTSSYNHITANTCINSQNAGAEEGYGICIKVVGCVENIVRSNTVSGNDVQWKDNGTNSDFEYRCSTAAEIQDAIDSIGTGTGTIVITAGTISITTALDVDGGGSYIIEGQGDNTVLTTGNNVCFNITNAKSCTIRNLKIDGTAHIALRGAITIDEGSDNSCIITKITIIGDNIFSVGVIINSDYNIISKCNISVVGAAMTLNASNYNNIDGNIIFDCGIAGIELNGANCSFNIINGNNITNSFEGVTISLSEQNIITNNVCSLNTGSANSAGIYGSDSHQCVLVGNICNDNDVGIYFIDSDYLTINGNNCCENNGSGIELLRFNKSLISNNNCSIMSATSAFSEPQGIYVRGGSSYNSFIGNICTDITNAGAGDGVGIYIEAGTDNIVSGNHFEGTDIGTSGGTGTRVFGDDTVYGAGWENDLGTATKNVIYNQFVATLAAAVALIEDDVYGAGWNGDTTHAPSQNTVYNAINAVAGFVWRTGNVSAADWNQAALAAIGNVANTWYDLDCSGIVPAGATAIYFKMIVQADWAGWQSEWRKNGETSVNPGKTFWTRARHDNTPHEFYVVIGCDSNRKVEFNCITSGVGNWNGYDVTILGWFTPP